MAIRIDSSSMEPYKQGLNLMPHQINRQLRHQRGAIAGIKVCSCAKVILSVNPQNRA